MTKGELILSLFDDDNVANEYKKICQKYKKYFSKYIKSKSDRCEEYEFISYIITGIRNEEIYIPTKEQRNKYFEKITMKQLNEDEEILNIVCTELFEEILNNDKVPKLNRPILYPIIYMLYDKRIILKDDDDIDDINDAFYKKCIQVVIDTNKDCTKELKKKTHKAATKIQKIFNRKWKAYKGK